MSERTPQNECYACKNKRSVPGDCHISCTHPDYNMKAEPWGVQNGWFIYPLYFDPVWKRSLCENFEVTNG